MEHESPRLWIVLGVLALVPRLLSIVEESAYLHPDALHQGLEPAFRAVHGFGQQTWEWREGLRSWVFPGLLAVPFWLAKALGLSGPEHGMGLAVGGARAVVALIDVVGVLLAARIAWRFGGRWVAIAVVAGMSVHPAQVVTGAQPLIDVPAATCLLWTCERGLATHRIDRARALWLGVALGLTAMLRVQLVPAVLVLPLAIRFLGRGGDAERGGSIEVEEGAWRRALVGASAVVLAFGLVDWLTWGAPFHSLVEYLRFNLTEGQTAMGVMPWTRYWDHYWVSIGLVAPLLLVGGCVGANRHRALALVLLCVLIPHQFIPYKVWRFVYPASCLGFLLAGLGLAAVVRWLSARRPRGAVAAGALCGLWMLGGSVAASMSGRLWETSWLYNQGGMDAVQASRGLNEAYLALGRAPAIHGVVQSVLPRNGAPGLSLLGHDVPIVHPLVSDRPDPPGFRPDFWIAREKSGETVADPRLRILHDEDRGVSIYRFGGQTPGG